MRFEWLAVSGAALVVGATALFFGAHLMPRPKGDGSVIQLAAASSDSWTLSAMVLMLAASGFLVGIPSLEPLLDRRRSGGGLVGMLLIALTAVLLAGFAMQLVLLRGLESDGGVSAAALDAAMGSPIQQGLLMSAFFSFFSGELLLAWALAVAGTVPRWVPWMFVGHVVGAGLTRVMEMPRLDDVPALLMVAGFAGTAIAANRADVAGRRLPGVRTRPGRPPA